MTSLNVPKDRLYGSFAQEGHDIVWQARRAPVRMLAKAARNAEQVNQVLPGHCVDVLDLGPQYAWVKTHLEGYEGFVAIEGFTDPTPHTHYTHRPLTAARRELIVQSEKLADLPMNSLLEIEEIDGKFARAKGMGWVSRSSITSLGIYAEQDFVRVMERHLSLTYDWGGLDCSRFLQQALLATGKLAPRDSSEQRMQLGVDVVTGIGYFGLRRGDMVFLKGHVAVMIDDTNLIHCTDDCMEVVIEPLLQVLARFKAEEDKEPWGFRRFPWYQELT